MRKHCPVCGGTTRPHCEDGNKCGWWVCRSCLSFGSERNTHEDATKRGPHG